MQVLSFAFNTQTIEKDERKGQHVDWPFNLPARQFAVEVAQFADEIAKCMTHRLLDFDLSSVRASPAGCLVRGLTYQFVEGLSPGRSTYQPTNQFNALTWLI